MADVRTPLLTAALLLAGCLGDVPTGGNSIGGADAGSGSADPAEAAWTSTIKPIMTSTTHNCANAVGCHGGTQMPRLTSWAELKVSGIPAGRYINKPGTENFIITKMQVPPGMHNAFPYLSTDEMTTFEAFIDMYGM